jgi:hypothetical protein
MLTKTRLLDVIDDINTTEPVIVAVTFDGGKIGRLFPMSREFFKLVDKWCINPRTGKLLFSETGIKKVQSHVHCFPLKVAFAKDTKALYKTEFDFFGVFKSL